MLLWRLKMLTDIKNIWNVDLVDLTYAMYKHLPQPCCFLSRGILLVESRFITVEGFRLLFESYILLQYDEIRCLIKFDLAKIMLFSETKLISNHGWS